MTALTCTVKLTSQRHNVIVIKADPVLTNKFTKGYYLYRLRRYSNKSFFFIQSTTLSYHVTLIYMATVCLAPSTPLNNITYVGMYKKTWKFFGKTPTNRRIFPILITDKCRRQA